MTSKRLLLLTTGGTIGGRVATSPDVSATAVDLMRGLAPTVARIKSAWSVDIKLIAEEIMNVDSSDVVPADWVKIISAIESNYDSYDGFIVTHGTNTMGYSCAALSFAFTNVGKPIVITGSQVPFNWPGSDALSNVENALRVAAWPSDDGLRGVVAVFGSHVIAGSRVKKLSDFDYDTLTSFSRSPLGRIGRTIKLDPVAVTKHHEYLERGRPAASTREELDVEKRFDNRILVFSEFPGLAPAVFQRVLQSLIEAEQLKGVVFAAFGAGDVSTHLHSCFEYLKSVRVPVVVATQVPNGASTFAVNEPGQRMAATDLAIPSFDMSMESMVVKLMWLLGQNVAYENMKQRMFEDLRGEVDVKVEC